MFRQTLSILLATALSGCPLICSARSTGDGVARGGGQCCGGCDAPTDEDSGPAPDSNGDSGEACECLCRGAIVDDAQQVDLDTSCSFPLADVAPRALGACLIQSEYRITGPWPDGGINVGRALCCLYSTLLC